MRLSRICFCAMFLAAVLSAQQPYPAQGPDNPDGSQAAPPDEPGRPVARISVLSGDASVRRGDSGDWVAAALNAPLMAGDSVSVAPGGAVEVQLDYANFVRIAGDSQIRIGSLDNGHFDIQLARGLVTYRILRESNAQPQISTPLIAVRPVRLAAARVEVFADGSTRVAVRHGEVEIYTPQGTEHAREGNLVMVRGATDDPEYQVSQAPAPDQWDSWNDQRDGYLSRSQSQRYVSQDIAGAEDLDAYGRWSYDPAYGNVWAPNVPATWAPYRNGQWVWEDYYGWTWVDADPWGWAPFHYGSWYQRAGVGWCWYPGERFHHYWWHPALVGFVGFGGGFGVGFGFGNVGWIPLAPFERYHPWYGRGGFIGQRGGFGGINIVNNTNITNIYRNSRVTNGVTAVTAGDFQRGNFRNPVPVSGGELQRASLVRGALPVTPGAQNLRFTDRAASSNTARADLSNQRFFSRAGNAPMAAQRTPFAQQQQAVRSAVEGRSVQPSSGAGWQRFGSPAQGAGRQEFAAPAQSQQPYQPRYSAPAAQQGSARGFYGEGGYSNPAPRTLQVAPPIVRQREYAPSYNAPAAPRGGGSFGSPAPVYRGSPAPAYRSAPAPAQRSNGGGGGNNSPRGGGNSNSGGHGNNRR